MSKGGCGGLAILVFLGALLLLPVTPAPDAQAAPEEAGALWPEVVDEVGDRAGFGSDLAGLVRKADPKWFRRASAAFVGWKIGGLLQQGKVREAGTLFVKWSAEAFVIGLSSAAPYYTAFNLWVTALKSARGHLADKMYATLWQRYVRGRTKDWAYDPDAADTRYEDNIWGELAALGGYDRFVEQWGPKGSADLKRHFQARFASEYDEDLKPIPLAADGNQELTRLAYEMRDKILRIQAVAVARSDWSVLPDARVEGSGPSLNPAVSHVGGAAAFTVRLGDIRASDRYTFVGHLKGQRASRTLSAEKLVAVLLGAGRDIFPCRIPMEIGPHIPEPPAWPLGTDQRMVLLDRTGRFQGGHFGRSDKRLAEHQAKAVQAFDTIPLPGPGRVVARVFVSDKQGVFAGKAYAVGRDPTITLGVFLPGESKIRWGLNIPQGTWPKGTKVRVLVEQDWRSASQDAVFFPCGWRVRAYFVPEGGPPPGQGYVTAVPSKPKPKPEPNRRRGWLTFEALGPTTLLADGTATCRLRAIWFPLDGESARGREIRISRPRVGHVQPSRSARTNQWGWARFVYTAPTPAVLRSVLDALISKEAMSGRQGLTATDVQSGLSKRIQLRVRMPAEGR